MRMELNDAVDRAYMAAEIFKAEKVETIIVAAGNQPWAAARLPEAELIKSVLLSWGVPESAMILDRKSRNTRENALNSKAIADKISCNQILLVTSAAHMPRADAAFRKVGMDVIPFPTDFRVVRTSAFTWLDFLPSAGALTMTSDAFREHIGLAVYTLKGWN